MSSEDSDFARRILRSLTPLLGPHTAERALDLVCAKLKVKRGTLTPMDFDATAEVLKPMLRTLVGRGVTDELITELRRSERA